MIILCDFLCTAEKKENNDHVIDIENSDVQETNEQNEKTTEVENIDRSIYDQCDHRNQIFKTKINIIFDKAVDLNLDGCVFLENVKIIFHQIAKINCKKTEFRKDVTIEFLEKADLDMENCKFYGLKDITSNEHSRLKLKNNEYKDDILFEGKSQTPDELFFSGCSFRRGARITYCNGPVYLSVEGNQHSSEKAFLVLISLLLLTLFLIGAYIAFSLL